MIIEKMTEREKSMRALYSALHGSVEIKVNAGRCSGKLWTGVSRDGRDLIFWEYFGLSAESMSLKSLRWIVRVIFQHTKGPVKFEIVTEWE